MRAAEHCRTLGGVATTAELLAAGETARSLRAAVVAGTLLRSREGVFVVADAPDGVAAASAHRGVLDCVSAARLHGLWTLDEGAAEPVHVRIPSSRNARVGDRRAVCVANDDGESGCRCVSHRHRMIEPAGRMSVGVVDALAAIRSCKGDEAFVAALESALRQRMLGPHDRERLRASLPANARRLVDFARADAERASNPWCGSVCAGSASACAAR
ncbi:hypothetical protein GCM10009761_13890 [Agromyces terreus]